MWKQIVKEQMIENNMSILMFVIIIWQNYLSAPQVSLSLLDFFLLEFSIKEHVGISEVTREHISPA